ncbi:MAG: DUF1579 domain-containing protein [Betaproteobacteria bacterium]|nr:DUF1579 domain-containing protein [Betaproteobacteria bacterium]MCC7216203.1 DUF1579 domain-containing protein [Burkholderiales bacterium]
MHARIAIVTAVALSAVSAAAQERPDPAALLAAQREALAAFAFMDGVWRGEATTILPSGEKRTIAQTERVGPLLDGAVRVIEGRGYDTGGRTVFNALGILSYDPRAKAFSMRSYAMGHAGDFAVQRTADGFRWEIPAGPTTIRYDAVVRDGTWTETGDRVAPGKDPVRFFEMRLARVGPSEWPGAGAIAPK